MDDKNKSSLSVRLITGWNSCRLFWRYYFKQSVHTIQFIFMLQVNAKLGRLFFGY